MQRDLKRSSYHSKVVKLSWRVNITSSWRVSSRIIGKQFHFHQRRRINISSFSLSLMTQISSQIDWRWATVQKSYSHRFECNTSAHWFFMKWFFRHRRASQFSTEPVASLIKQWISSNWFPSHLRNIHLQSIFKWDRGRRD